MDSGKCAVLVPFSTALELETEQGLRKLADRGYCVQMLRGASQIDLARSMMATRALRAGFTETLWIDSDIAFDPDDVEKLRAHNLPITAGLYPKKGPKEFAGKFKPGPRIKFGVGGGLLEMEYVGAGFIHVRAEVYERIERDLKLPLCGGGYDGEKIVPFFIPMVVREGEDLVYLSEDYSLCHRAKLVGYQIFADTTIRLGHVGRHAYTWDDLAQTGNLESLEVSVS